MRDDRSASMSAASAALALWARLVFAAMLAAAAALAFGMLYPRLALAEPGAICDPAAEREVDGETVDAMRPGG